MNDEFVQGFGLARLSMHRAFAAGHVAQVQRAAAHRLPPPRH